LCGDWGLGIGDWAQSPIPNPQSPILLFGNKPELIKKSIKHTILYKMKYKIVIT